MAKKDLVSEIVAKAIELRGGSPYELVIVKLSSDDDVRRVEEELLARNTPTMTLDMLSGFSPGDREIDALAPVVVTTAEEYSEILSARDSWHAMVYLMMPTVDGEQVVHFTI